MLLEMRGGLAGETWNLALSGNPLSPAERAEISLSACGVRERGTKLPVSLPGQWKRTGGSQPHKRKDTQSSR